MADDLGAKIVAESRTWLGTRFSHQERTKRTDEHEGGVDCVNFVAAVGLASGAVPDAEFERNYRRHETGEEMARLFREYMTPLNDWSEAQPGDVLVVGYRGQPRHCMIVTERQGDEFTVIEAAKPKVAEHRIDGSTKRRIHSAYRANGL